METGYTKLTDTIDFKYSLHCLDCVYEDLGYNGTKQCLPKTKSCKPINSYDFMMKSRQRFEDTYCPDGMSRNQRNKNVANLGKLKRTD